MSWKNSSIECNLVEIKKLYDEERDCDKLKDRKFIANSMSTFTEYILITKDLINVECDFIDQD